MHVPEGWRQAHFGEAVTGSVLRNNDGKLGENDLRSVNKSEGMIPMKDRVKGKSTEQCKIVKQGWFAYNPMRLNIGSICQWSDEKNCLVSPDYVVFRCKDRILDPAFMNQFRQSYYWQNFMKNAGNGSVRVRIYLKDLAPLKLLLPPFSEQQKIAQILSTWDKAIEKLEALIAAKQKRKKALMQQLLTGKMRFFGFSSEWKSFSLKEIAHILVSPVDKKTIENEQPALLCNYTDVYYNIRITKSLAFMRATATEQEISKFSLKKGDVIITKDSETPGDIAIPAFVSDDLGGVVCGYHLAILRPKKGKIDGEFLSYLFSLPKTRYYFYTLATGATRFGLSIGAIEKANFHLPPIDEQQKIATVLSVADNEITLHQNQLAALQQQKKGLMQQLLTGKRRVQLEKDFQNVSI